MSFLVHQISKRIQLKRSIQGSYPWGLILMWLTMVIFVLVIVPVTCLFRLAAEHAWMMSPQKGPGSVRINLLDVLYTIDQEAVENGVKIHQIE